MQNYAIGTQAPCAQDALVHCMNGACAVACRAGADARSMFRAVQAKGEGYALSTAEELQFTLDVAQATGDYRAQV